MTTLLQRFYDHLRAERLSKLSCADMLETGVFHLSRREAGGPMRDISAEHAETLRNQIAEIEQLLHDAGEPSE